MIFNLVSDSNFSNPFIYSQGKWVLVYTFEKCVEVHGNLCNFLSPIVNENTYWCENIDEFIKDFLKQRAYPVKPLVTSDEKFEFIIEIDNEVLCLKDKTIYSLDKRIAQYFNDSIDLPNKIDEFNLLMKSIGVIDYSFNDVKNRLIQYFKSDYKYFIPVLYDIMQEQQKIYSEELFKDIIFSKHHLESTKIYNVTSEFDVRKDKKGKYFQCEYNEGLTGRLFPTGQSLQTLAKEKRDLVIAEEGCYFLEFDFKTFEFNILLDILGIEKVDDPHSDVIRYLGLKCERQIGKDINYSYLYGMTAERVCEKIKDQTGIEIDVEILKSYKLFQKRLHVDVYNGILFNYFGRPIKVEKEYAAFNNFIQSTAADIFFKKFKQVAELLDGDMNKIILQNHDSLLIQLTSEIISKTDIAQRILEILKTPIKIFTFDIEVKYGKVWSELS
jgi:hypothetical protein